MKEKPDPPTRTRTNNLAIPSSKLLATKVCDPQWDKRRGGAQHHFNCGRGHPGFLPPAPLFLEPRPQSRNNVKHANHGLAESRQ